MAKIKLVEAERIFIPNVEFPTENGKEKNRELPEEDQVKCEIELATIGQKNKYIGSYSVAGKKGNKEVKSFIDFHYDTAVRKHCTKVTGLEDFGVKDGNTLLESAKKYPVLNDVIQEVFFKINGIHEDDTAGGSDGGELTEGEE